MGQAWKQLERDAATALGGRRAGNRGDGGPDVRDVPGWLCECKYRATFTHDTLYRQEKAKRRKELRAGAKFALVTRARGKEPLVTITLKDFGSLVRPRSGRNGGSCAPQGTEPTLPGLGADDPQGPK